MRVERDQLVSDLKYHVLEVIFEKVSTGELRKMKCTLMRGELPLDLQSDKRRLDEHIKMQRDPNNEVVVVWDLDERGWRSFRLDSVVNVQVLSNW